VRKPSLWLPLSPHIVLLLLGEGEGERGRGGGEGEGGGGGERRGQEGRRVGG